MNRRQLLQLAAVSPLLAGAKRRKGRALAVSLTDRIVMRQTYVRVGRVGGATESIIRGPSAWTTPIPANPVLDDDPNVGAWLTTLRNTSALHYTNGYFFSTPTYWASTSDPQYTVVATAGGPLNAAATAYNPLRIPNTAAPSAGDDGWVVVVDEARGIIAGLWQASKSGGVWSCTNLGIHAWPYDGSQGPLAGYGNGAGLVVSTGAITAAEIRSGVIPHALPFASSIAGAGHRHPAWGSDGDFPNGLPEGARVQLDPSLVINTTNYPGITPGEIAIAKALQIYGGYCWDAGDHPMSFPFRGEGLADATRNPPLWPGDETAPGGALYDSGLIGAAGGGGRGQFDYFNCSKIPWGSLRILKHWHGGANA